MARRALITGATGGLGLALAEALLEAGYAVRTTGRNAAAGARLAGMVADFRAADLTDASALYSLCEGMDVVFHAAALSSPWGREADFEAINVVATHNLLQAAQRAGCGAFVFISTPSVYAEARDRLNLTEASPLARRFASAYARTKHRAEVIVLAANGPGFTTVALRPRALVGPDDQVLLPRILRVARRGRFPLFRDGEAMIDLTDVRDAAQAALAVDRQFATVAGRVFNISGGQPASVRATLALAFEAMGLNPRLVPAPYPAAAVAAAVMEGVCAVLPGRPEPPVTRYSLMTLAFTQTFDLTAPIRDLGWRPRHSPAEAIARTASAWRSHAPG